MSPQGWQGMPESHSKATFPWAHVQVFNSHSLLHRSPIPVSWLHVALAQCPWWSMKSVRAFLDITEDSRWTDSGSLHSATLEDKCHSWAPAPAKLHVYPHAANLSILTQ